MNKSIVLITLFSGFLIGSSTAKAATSNANIFKSMTSLPHSFFDPRDDVRNDKSETSDDSSETVQSEPKQDEE